MHCNCIPWEHGTYLFLLIKMCMKAANCSKEMNSDPLTKQNILIKIAQTLTTDQ